jgi:GAF domain-containing protein
VAGRVLTDMARHDDPQLDEIRRRFEQTGLDTGSAGYSEITDPLRLEVVARTGLLDSPPDPAIDRIVMMAAGALGTRSATLAILDRDRVFLKSVVGVPPDVMASRELSLERSMSHFLVESRHTLAIDDARVHPRTKDQAVVREGVLVAYLGIPLRDMDGYLVGTLSVWDAQPHAWGKGHIETLHNLASMLWVHIFGSPSR